MKHLIPVLALLVVCPGAARAQIDIVFSGSQPVARANVGGLMVSARVGSRGNLDVRVNEGRAARARGTEIPRDVSRTRAGRATAGAVLTTADTHVGTKYVWGGDTPSGFDCSGFVQYVFRQHGVQLPRTSRQQVAVGQSIARARTALQAGDLMFFATNGSRIDHVALYAGGDQIIHSSASGGGVLYDNFTTKRGKWFLSHHVATRRVLADGQSLVGILSAALRAVAEYDPPDRAPRR